MTAVLVCACPSLGYDVLPRVLLIQHFVTLAEGDTGGTGNTTKKGLVSWWCWVGCCWLGWLVLACEYYTVPWPRCLTQ